MQNKINLSQDKKRFIIIGIIIAIIGLGLFMLPNNTQKSDLVLNVENASAAAVKSSIELYYAQNNEYPYSQQAFIDAAILSDKESPVKGYKGIVDTISKLSDFKYTVRGDNQAYKFIYTGGKENKTITIEGNYKEDYK